MTIKYIHPDMMDDGGLSGIMNYGDYLHLCPLTVMPDYAGVLAASLASEALTPADYSLAAGVVSGRRLVLAQKGPTGSGDGTVNHAVILDTLYGRILAIIPHNAYYVAAGSLVYVPSFTVWEIHDPA